VSCFKVQSFKKEIQNYLNLGTLAYTCNSSTWEERQKDQEFKASLVYTARPYFKKKTTYLKITLEEKRDCRSVTECFLSKHKVLSLLPSKLTHMHAHIRRATDLL
jgi:hypothetical protein